jgi:integrase
MTETADKRKGRAPNGASTIYKGREGSWHGRVTMGVRDDGRPDRRHVEAMTRAAATRKVRELERQRAAGTAGKPGRAWTVGQWLTHWVETIAAPIVRDNTLAGYRSRFASTWSPPWAPTGSTDWSPSTWNGCMRG